MSTQSEISVLLENIIDHLQGLVLNLQATNEMRQKMRLLYSHLTEILKCKFSAIFPATEQPLGCYYTSVT